MDTGTMKWTYVTSVDTDELGEACFNDLNPYMDYMVSEIAMLDSQIQLGEPYTPALPTSVVFVHGTDFQSGGTATANFLNARNIDICGMKLEDVTLNCWGNDAPVEGWRIDIYGYANEAAWLIRNSCFHAIAYTDVDGKFCFEGLNPYMIYKVVEETRSDWMSVSKTCYDHLMATGSGIDIVNINFLNAERGEICGHKYADVNVNGQYDPSVDKPLAGWVVKLYVWMYGAWIYVTSDITDANGDYCFTCLNPYLSYKVVEQTKCDWIAMSPECGSYSWIRFSTSGQSIENVDFLNAQAGPAGLTIGFWKTNIAKNLPRYDHNYINGKPQVSGSTISNYLTAIYLKYYVGMGYHYDYLYYPSSMTQVQKLQKAYQYLNVYDNSIMKQKAQAQILSLLLTEQYKGASYDNSYVVIPNSITGHGMYTGLMSATIVHVLNHYSAGQYAQAQREADYLNNLGH
jgi:hypothetical protein